LPSGKIDASDHALREAEEFAVDLALACLSSDGRAGAEPHEAKARLASAISLAVRPPQSIPELSKEAKAGVKKQRLRVRGAILALLKSLAAAEPTTPMPAPKPKVAATAAPAPQAVAAGAELVAAEEGAIFESLDSYDEVGPISVGQMLVAAGSAIEVDGYWMVPIKPKGAVELRILRAVVAPPSEKPSKGKGGKTDKSNSGTSEPELDGCLKDFVRIAAFGPSYLEQAEDELKQVCFGGFDPAAALEAEASKPAAVEDDSTKAEGPSPNTKAGKKTGKAKQPAADEDLDALLQEFGMTPQASKSSKKKGKK
jgi:hypothetical protein